MEDIHATTMRIDIHPDFVDESLAKKRKGQEGSTVFLSANDPTSVLIVKEDQYKSDYERLLQSVYDAVLITDRKGVIMDCNERAVNFFLCEASDLNKNNIVNLISGADSNLLTAIQRNLVDHRYTLIEAMCIRSDKSNFPAEIAVNKIELQDERSLCFFVRDVTIRKRAQEALEDAVLKLEEHDKSKSEFVSNVSHELRTPLTSMTYAISNMLRGVVGQVPESMRRYLEMLDADCKRLLGTVNDILDLRKIENKTLTLTKSLVPFERLVSRIADALKVQAVQKSIIVDVRKPAKSWFVECDMHKMERVVLNVLGNAVKFTPDGGKITFEFFQDADHPENLVVSVTDTGIGIPPEALEKVTTRYFTVGEQACGTGLGLSISKEIVEMHGGSLSIQSPPVGADKGTVVYISMPFAEPPIVLVVDDDPLIRDILSLQITNQGYRVITAASGAEALAMVDEHNPLLVIVDFILPDMNGKELILKLKSNKATMRIPIIVITGADVDKDGEKILSSFSIPALAKPWREHELIDRVEGAFLGFAALVR